MTHRRIVVPSSSCCLNILSCCDAMLLCSLVPDTHLLCTIMLVIILVRMTPCVCFHTSQTLAMCSCIGTAKIRCNCSYTFVRLTRACFCVHSRVLLTRDYFAQICGAKLCFSGHEGVFLRRCPVSDEFVLILCMMPLNDGCVSTSCRRSITTRSTKIGRSMRLTPSTLRRSLHPSSRCQPRVLSCALRTDRELLDSLSCQTSDLNSP